MNKNERLQALQILIPLVRDKRSLAQLMPSSSDITPMTKEMCFGVCRHFFRLEAITLCLVDKKPKDVDVWILLLLGIYQLHYMQLPDYAVVKETVALLPKIKKVWAKGLVNAVLRNFCRQKEAILMRLQQNFDFINGHPQWFLARIQKAWPNDWQSIVQANDAHPPMTLRVNQMHCSVSTYMNLLEAAGIQAIEHPVAKDAIVLTAPCNVHQLPGFDKGWVSVQDAAAQLAVTLLDLKPGLRVLDACCAPGGKTCHILEASNKQVLCTALDVDAKRLLRVKDNLKRLDLEAEVLEGDAMHPESWWDGKPYDRILLDAPCSATGVIRRHADIKLLRTPEEVEEITKIQQAMLSSLWKLLAPGGRLVYATCSILPEENELQIAAFAAANADCKLVTSQWSWGRPTGHGQQILPGEFNMDGFFYSLLLKDDK